MSVIILGDESGYTVGEVQRAKLAAIEAEWETEEAPASFTLIGFPNEETRTTDYAIKFPYLLGLIATRSIDEKVDGLDTIRERKRHRIFHCKACHLILDRDLNASRNILQEALRIKEQKAVRVSTAIRTPSECQTV